MSSESSSCPRPEKIGSRATSLQVAEAGTLRTRRPRCTVCVEMGPPPAGEELAVLSDDALLPEFVGAEPPPQAVDKLNIARASRAPICPDLDLATPRVDINR